MKVINRQAEVVFGYLREELLGHPGGMLLPERLRDRHPEERGAYTGAPRTRPMGAGLELYGRHRDGSEFPVEISLSPLQTEHGLLVSSVIRDVSRRKREEAKFRTLGENIPAATFPPPPPATHPPFSLPPQSP